MKQTQKSSASQIKLMKKILKSVKKEKLTSKKIKKEVKFGQNKPKTDVISKKKITQPPKVRPKHYNSSWIFYCIKNL